MCLWMLMVQLRFFGNSNDRGSRGGADPPKLVTRNYVRVTYLPVCGLVMPTGRGRAAIERERPSCTIDDCEVSLIYAPRRLC